MNNNLEAVNNNLLEYETCIVNLKFSKSFTRTGIRIFKTITLMTILYFHEAQPINLYAYLKIILLFHHLLWMKNKISCTVTLAYSILISATVLSPYLSISKKFSFTISAWFKTSFLSMSSQMKPNENFYSTLSLECL